jgi:hypothetical protein
VFGCCIWDSDYPFGIFKLFLIPNTMDEDKPLLEKEDENNTECIGIRTKVVLYVVIFDIRSQNVAFLFMIFFFHAPQNISGQHK